MTTTYLVSIHRGSDRGSKSSIIGIQSWIRLCWIYFILGFTTTILSTVCATNPNSAPNSSRTSNQSDKHYSSMTDETLNHPNSSQPQQDKNLSSVKNVVVVGGTHGNEYTGVWIIQALQRRLESKERSNHDDSKQTSRRLYDSLELQTVLGNPKAYLENKRFIDQDLNRQFSYKALVTDHLQSSTKDTNVPVSWETQRARQLNDLLGPKFIPSTTTTDTDTRKMIPNPHPKADMIIDLHTTTTNMGTTLIVAQGDTFTTKAAAYVILKCHQDSSDTKNNTEECNNMSPNKISVLLHTHKNQESRPHLSSIAPHCFSIEAGPVPQGVLRHDIVEHTQQALDATLEFVHRYNTEPEKVDEELRAAFPSGILDCYVSAPSQRPGEISSKISWPSNTENPNFPSYLIHHTLQDQDFAELHTGDPLFVDLDGTIIPYDGSHGSPVRIMFVNEGGYYYASSGTGISVAHRRQFRYDTAELL